MKLTLLGILLFMNAMVIAQNAFKVNQLKFARVEDAYKEKWPALEYDLIEKGYAEGFSMLINVYKAEGKLELWLKERSGKAYKLFETYDFCQYSGILGPKVIEGDKQTPEGFYYINVFNPMSSFHLSLGINYPNSVDSLRTGPNRKTGGNIYIHGDCVTVGCIPLTDDKIEEVYILAVEARKSGQEKIAVNLYPFRMSNENTRKYLANFPKQQEFWKTLQIGYSTFKENKRELKVREVEGKYLVK